MYFFLGGGSDILYEKFRVGSQQYQHSQLSVNTPSPVGVNKASLI